MGLETATYIDSLVTSNPAGTDQASTADDHIRLLKAALQRTFPNIAGEVSASAGGLNNAAIGAISVSFAASASYAVSANYATSADHATSAIFATSATRATSASFATSANYAASAGGAVSAQFATSATNATSAVFATSATRATSASFATSANHAASADHALSAVFATSATRATSASFATSANHAASAVGAVSAQFATSATRATSATFANSASYAWSALAAVSAQFATSATRATSAVFATQIQFAAATRGLGLNSLPDFTKDATHTVSQGDIGKAIIHGDATDRRYVLISDSNISAGAVVIFQNMGTGAISVSFGAGVTINYLDGSSVQTGSRIIAQAGMLTVKKRSGVDTVYDTWGFGVT